MHKCRFGVRATGWGCEAGCQNNAGLQKHLRLRSTFRRRWSSSMSCHSSLPAIPSNLRGLIPAGPGGSLRAPPYTPRYGLLFLKSLSQGDPHTQNCRF